MFKKTIYILIISLILSIISVVAYVYAIFYVGGMGSELKALHQESSDLDQESERLNSIKRVAENADQNQQDLYKFIIPVESEGAIGFVKLIEGLSDKYNLKYNTNSIEIVGDDNLSKINKEYLSVKFTASGSRTQLFNFMNKVETAPYNIRVKAFSLTKVSGNVSASSTSSMDLWQIDAEILVIKEK